MQSVVVKVFYECERRERPEVRRFPGPDDSAPTYAFVHDKVTQVFKQLETGTFNMYWKDGEGDFVTCSSEQEMEEALSSVKDSVLRIYIRNASPVVSEEDEWDFDPRMQGWSRGWGKMGGMRGAMPMRGMPPPPHVHRWMKRMKRWNKKHKCHESKAEGEVTPSEELDTDTADNGAQAGKDAPDLIEGRGDSNDTEMKADDQSGTQKCGRGKKGRGKRHKHDKHPVEDPQTKDDDTSGSSDEDMPPPFFGHPGMFAGGPMPFWGMMGMHPHAWGGGCWNRRGGWRRGGRGGCKRSWECSSGKEPRDMGFAGWEDGRGDPREGCRGRFRGHPRGEGHGRGHGHAQCPRRRCRRQNEADEPMEACIEEMRNVKATDDVIILGDENEAPKM